MSTKRKVAILIPWMALGGADRCSLDIARACIEEGDEVKFIATRHNEERIPYHNKRNLFQEVAPVILEEEFAYPLMDWEPDVVIVSNCLDAFENLEHIKQACPDCKLVILHHMFLPAPWDFERTFTSPDIDLILTVSDRLARELRAQNEDYQPIAPLRWFGFHPSERDALRKRREPIVVCPARIAEQKRPLFIPDVVKACAARGCVPDFHIYGGGHMEERLRQAIDSEALDLTVKFMGERAFYEMAPVYESAAVLLCPSIDEGIPLSYFEAMETMTALAVSDVGAVSELVPPPYLVPLFADNEAELYADIIVRHIALDEQAQKQLMQAHQRAGEFRYEEWKAQLLQHIQ